MTAVSSFYLAPNVETAIETLFRTPGRPKKTARAVRHTATVTTQVEMARQLAMAKIAAILQGGSQSAPSTASNPDIHVTNIVNRYATVQSPTGDPANDIMNLIVDRALWLNTGGGCDTLNINARRAEFIDTGNGDDLVNISARLAAFIRGGAGNDKLNITASDYAGLIEGGDGDDLISVAARLASFIDGGDGGDVINIAANEADWISGDAGNDIVNVAAGRAWGVSGGTGDDILNIAARVARDIDGGAGNDTINIAARDVSWVYGQSGNDVINIATMHDTLGANGGADNDTINITASKAYLTEGGTGDDRITLNTPVVNWVRGGRGNDTISFVDTTDASVSFALGDGKDVYALSGEVGKLRFDLERGLTVNKAFVLEKYHLLLVTFESSDDAILIDYSKVSNDLGAPSVVLPPDKGNIFISWGRAF